MITFKVINDVGFECLLKKFDADIDHLKNHSGFNIELNTYGNLLRIALNNIQPESFDNLTERTNINHELEKALDNAGGYTTSYLAEDNPKASLFAIFKYLKANTLKLNAVLEAVNSDSERKTVIADINDIDYLTRIFRTNRIKVISFTQFKKNTEQFKNLVIYSFNGKMDFNFICNLQQDSILSIYAQEYELYLYQMQKRKLYIEEEAGNNGREQICGIIYEPIKDLPIHISPTIEGIINRATIYPLDQNGRKTLKIC